LARESAAPLLLLLLRSLSAQSDSLQVMLTTCVFYGMRLSFDNLTYVMLPKSVWSLLRIDFQNSIVHYGIFILVFRKFLEANRNFTLKIDSGIRVRLIGTN